jgi:hypothetical protein
VSKKEIVNIKTLDERNFEADVTVSRCIVDSAVRALLDSAAFRQFHSGGTNRVLYQEDLFGACISDGGSGTDARVAAFGHSTYCSHLGS